MNIPSISRERLKELVALSRKKERLESGRVILEGTNLISQLMDNKIEPLEIYVEAPHPLLELHPETPVFKLMKGDLQRICDTHHAQGIAALYPAPRPRDVVVHRALYLDGISDPGNLGTIFRIAAAFNLDTVLLSEDCVEISSPKVIRASLGSVYWVPHRILPHAMLFKLDIPLVCLEMQGKVRLKDYSPPELPCIYVIGSEAHGVSENLSSNAANSLRIEMAPQMESLNAAVATGILAHHLFK